MHVVVTVLGALDDVTFALPIEKADTSLRDAVAVPLPAHVHDAPAGGLPPLAHAHATAAAAAADAHKKKARRKVVTIGGTDDAPVAAAGTVPTSTMAATALGPGPAPTAAMAARPPRHHPVPAHHGPRPGRAPSDTPAPAALLSAATTGTDAAAALGAAPVPVSAAAVSMAEAGERAPTSEVVLQMSDDMPSLAHLAVLGAPSIPTATATTTMAQGGTATAARAPGPATRTTTTTHTPAAAIVVPHTDPAPALFQATPASTTTTTTAATATAATAATTTGDAGDAYKSIYRRYILSASVATSLSPIKPTAAEDDDGQTPLTTTTTTTATATTTTAAAGAAAAADRPDAQAPGPRLPSMSEAPSSVADPAPVPTHTSTSLSRAQSVPAEPRAAALLVNTTSLGVGVDALDRPHTADGGMAHAAPPLPPRPVGEGDAAHDDATGSHSRQASRAGSTRSHGTAAYAQRERGRSGLACVNVASVEQPIPCSMRRTHTHTHTCKHMQTHTHKVSLCHTHTH
jgi:hypothetical protein